MGINFKTLLIPVSVLGTAVGVTVIAKDAIGGEKAPSDIKIIGRTAIVTGANSGIGKEVARDLAKRGGRVLMACRNLKKCEEVRQKIIEESFNRNVHCRQLDLASIDSIREFAEDVNKNEKRVDILVNNAGVMGFKKKEVTNEGFEQQLGVNYLGHFLLTNLLLDKLKSSAPSRVINTGSVSCTKAHINFKDLNSDNGYSWNPAYTQSKLANVFFTKELATRLEGTGVKPFCVLPGLTKTAINRHLSISKSYISSVLVAPFLWMIQKTPLQGAQCTIYCAVDPALIEKETGNYFSNCEEVNIAGGDAMSDDKAKRLWLISEKWTNLVD